MPDNDLTKRILRVTGLVGELDTITDPKTRASVKELLQLVMDMHAAALERILGTLFEKGEIGRQTIDQLGVDPLISSLLVLYGLHPEELESRIAGALQKASPDLRSHGVEAKLGGIDGASVTIHASVAVSSCGSTARTARTILENAIFEAAPDVGSLVIEGLDGKEASGFVPLRSLLDNEVRGLTSASGELISRPPQPAAGETL